MTKLTKEQTEKVVNTIVAANESVRGTEDYYKYHMQMESYIENKDPFTGKTKGHWSFTGHYIPSYIHQNDDVIIYKKIRDVEWLYYGDERYMLDETIKALFK